MSRSFNTEPRRDPEAFERKVNKVRQVRNERLSAVTRETLDQMAVQGLRGSYDIRVVGDQIMLEA